MAEFVNTFFEERVEQLFDLASLVEQIFSSAGLEYRIVGGWQLTCMSKTLHRTRADLPGTLILRYGVRTSIELRKLPGRSGWSSGTWLASICWLDPRNPRHEEPFTSS